eukprot:scaffold5364_cov164-Amphora_coffeaeformis.AAC.7
MLFESQRHCNAGVGNNRFVVSDTTKSVARERPQHAFETCHRLGTGANAFEAERRPPWILSGLTNCVELKLLLGASVSFANRHVLCVVIFAPGIVPGPFSVSAGDASAATTFESKLLTKRPLGSDTMQYIVAKSFVVISTRAAAFRDRASFVEV